MQLVTLGGLRLEGSDFKEQQPLVLLTYAALKSKVRRDELAGLFWPSKESIKRSRSMSECLARLRDAEASLLRKHGDDLVASVDLDVFEFEDAVLTQDFERALSLYTGTFLLGVGISKRWRLAEELEEWLDQKRTHYQGLFVMALLELVDLSVQLGESDRVSLLVAQLLDLPMGVRVLAVAELKRLYVSCQLFDLVDLLDRIESLALSEHGVSCKTVLSNEFSLVGRDELLNKLTTLCLEGQRLLVLTGLGGVGKTVLARALLSRLSTAFRAVLFVSLEKLSLSSSEEDVLFELKLAMGLSSSEKKAVFSAVARQNLLIVFDNFEQLVQLERFLMAFLEACPNVQLVVTSRVHLTKGHHVELKSLDIQTDALVLLDEELQRLGLRSTAFSEVNLLELCRLVGGLPLALKLAANWLTSYSLSGLISDLKHSDDALVISSERHGDMHKVIAFSVDLLPAAEQKVLYALAVFVGGFNLRAAQVVAGASKFQLRHLVRCSLLQFDVECERYSFHPLITAFLQPFSFQDAHAKYYLNLLQDPEKVSALSADVVNIQKAWVYALESGWFKLCFDLLPDLRILADALGRPNIAFEVCDVHQMPADFQGRLLATKAWLFLRNGDYVCARSFAEQALSLHQDIESQILALNALGAVSDLDGYFEDAQRYFHKVLELSNNALDKQSAVLNLAVNAINLGCLDGAATCLSDVPANVIRGRYLYACLQLEKSQFLKALSGFEALLDLLPEHSHWHLQVQPKIAETYLNLKEFLLAEQVIESALELAQSRGLFVTQSALLKIQGDCFFKQGQIGQAVAYYSFSLETSLDSGSLPLLLSRMLRLLCSNSLSTSMQSQLYHYCDTYSSRMFFADRQLFKAFLLKSERKQNLSSVDMELTEFAYALLSYVKRKRGARHPVYEF